jgi:hypothetical protein
MQGFGYVALFPGTVRVPRCDSDMSGGKQQNAVRRRTTEEEYPGRCSHQWPLSLLARLENHAVFMYALATGLSASGGQSPQNSIPPLANFAPSAPYAIALATPIVSPGVSSVFLVARWHRLSLYTLALRQRTRSCCSRPPLVDKRKPRPTAIPQRRPPPSTTHRTTHALASLVEPLYIFFPGRKGLRAAAPLCNDN